MSLKLKYIFIIVTLTIIIFAFYYVFNVNVRLAPLWEKKRSIRYSYELSNKTPKPIKNIVFKTYSPLEMTPTQKVLNRTSNLDFSIIDEGTENKVLSFPIKLVPPFGKVRVQVTVDLVLSDVLGGVEINEDMYLNSQHLIELNDKNVKTITDNFNPSSKSVIKEVHNWLVNNMEYTGYGQRDRGAAYAAKNLQGDCTEYAYLATAIFRGLGLPARAVSGYIVNNDMKLRPTGLHTWSEVYYKGTWQNIDAQKNSFMENQSSYIAMNVGDGVNREKNSFGRFWVSDSDIIVTMK